MTLEGDAVDRRLHRRVEQLDDQRQQAHGDQDGALAATDVEQEGQRQQHAIEQHQLAERRFAAEGRAQAIPRIAGSVEDAFEAGLALEG
ncbi:hypothetical protein D9M71_246520 [compost metagenome]